MEVGDNSQNEAILWRVLNFLHRYLCIFIRLLMVKLYDERGQSMPPIDDRLLLESATSIAEKIRTKQVSAVQVMNAFIRRIKQINPLLNCVVGERYKDALDEAAKVDEFIASNKYSVDELRKTKPFLGVPISTKDSIRVKDMIHSYGLWYRRNECAEEDAEVIRLMRAAGAIPFVITNIPELAMWFESANTIYGRSRNPYDTNRTPGGSSGGECALLAAAGSPFGIGSDIGGSIRIPAVFNGIFGHKTSALIVSNDGTWPNTRSPKKEFNLVYGPMCKHSCDLKPMLKIMAGDKAKLLRLDEPVNLSKVNFFYQKDDGGGMFSAPVDNDIRVGIENTLQHIENTVGVKPKHVKLDALKEMFPLWMANIMEETDIPFECKLANFNGRVDSYRELLKWCVGMSKHTLPGIYFGIYGKFAPKLGSPDQVLKVKQREDLLRKFDEMLGDNGVLIYPTHPTVAPYHNECLLRLNSAGYTAIFNSLGLPSTSIPLGIGPTERLPIGLQVVANRNQDRLCLAVATELERAFGGWVAPEIIA